MSWKWLGAQKWIVYLFAMAAMAMATMWYSSRNPDTGPSVGHARLTYDPSNPAEVVSAFTDIYFGKVVEDLGAQKVDGIVQTRFKVEVLDAVKGDLSGQIIVSQFGGIYEGEKYLFFSDEVGLTPLESRNDYMLKVGEIYLMASITHNVHEMHVLSTDASGLVRISAPVAKANFSVSEAMHSEPRAKVLVEEAWRHSAKN